MKNCDPKTCPLNKIEISYGDAYLVLALMDQRVFGFSARLTKEVKEFEEKLLKSIGGYQST